MLFRSRTSTPGVATGLAVTGAGGDVLFNGKDLTGLTTWLKDTKDADPRKVFTAKDGIIHVSDDGKFIVGNGTFQGRRRSGEKHPGRSRVGPSPSPEPSPIIAVIGVPRDPRGRDALGPDDPRDGGRDRRVVTRRAADDRPPLGGRLGRRPGLLP